jgi:lysophospholipase L1-like esterase
MRLSVLLLVACSNDHPASAPAPAASGSAPESVAATTSASAAASASATAAASASATAAVTEMDAGIDAGRAPPKSVLHVGDSMVGGFGGLTKALEAHFKPLGSKFARDWQTSVSIQTFARDKKFGELIAKNDPDLVIITLGANDMAAPFPKSLGPFIAAIAKKTAGRECWWLPPVPWSKDTALIQVIKDNAAPCKVYDGSSLKISRGPDGIHPTDGGGAVWSKGFVDAYEAPITSP